MVSCGQQRTKQKEKIHVYFQKAKTNQGASAVVWFQRGTHFRQWRIWRWRIIWAHSWKPLSCNIAFFCFPLFFSYWLLIHPEMKHWLLRFLRVDWTTSPCHFRQDFAFHQDEVHWFSSCLVLALCCFLFKDFSLFWSVSWRQSELVSIKAWAQSLSVNEKMLSSWNRVFPAKVAGESMTYEDYDNLAVY